MVFAVASLIALLVAAGAVVMFAASRALSGRHLDDDLRRYDEPVPLREAAVDDVARAA